MFVKKVPNPDSDIVSQIHVINIAPITNKKLVTATCLALKQYKHLIYETT